MTFVPSSNFSYANHISGVRNEKLWFVLLMFLGERFSLDSPVPDTLTKNCLKMRESKIRNQVETFYNCIHVHALGLSILNPADYSCDSP